MAASGPASRAVDPEPNEAAASGPKSRKQAAAPRAAPAAQTAASDPESRRSFTAAQ